MVWSDQLIPGDVIEIYPDYSVPCDVLLLNGSAIVDESLLTGEAMPVLKTMLPMNDQQVEQSPPSLKVWFERRYRFLY